MDCLYNDGYFDDDFDPWRAVVRAEEPFALRCDACGYEWAPLNQNGVMLVRNCDRCGGLRLRLTNDAIDLGSVIVGV